MATPVPTPRVILNPILFVPLTILKFAALVAVLSALLTFLTFLRENGHSRNLHIRVRTNSPPATESADSFPFPHKIKKLAVKTTCKTNATNKFVNSVEEELKVAKMSHKPKRSRARFTRSRADLSAISSSDERSDREVEQERRLRGAFPHGAASLPPQNRRPIQHTACFLASTTGNLVYKFGINRWCNYDSSDPSYDRLINPCVPGDCIHKKTIDPVISTTEFDTSHSSIGSKLASLSVPVDGIQNLDGGANYEDVENAENDDRAEAQVPAPNLETAEAAEVLPAAANSHPDEKEDGEAKEKVITITLSTEANSEISSEEAMSASEKAKERPEISITYASTSTPNTSNILDQDTAELPPANNQEVGNYYPIKPHCSLYSAGGCNSKQRLLLSSSFSYSTSYSIILPFQANDQGLDSTVESNHVGEEIYRRSRSEEIAEGRPRYPGAHMLARHDPTEIDHRQVLVNLVNHARLLAEMNWDWRSDVADINREEALENLALLYDSLIDRYDHLVVAYDVLAQIYGESNLSADGTNATSAADGPVQDEQVSVVQDNPVLENGAAEHDEHVNGPAPVTNEPLATAGPSGLEGLSPNPSTSPRGLPVPDPVPDPRGAIPKFPRVAIPKGYARCESGRVVKTGEVSSPKTKPCKTSQTSYPIPQPSTSFSNITRISNVTQSSAISQTSPNSTSNWLSDIFAEADVVATAGNVEESDNDDEDYIPGKDPAEAGTKGDATTTVTSDSSGASESSSLRTFWAGQTNSSLYSHLPETSLQAKTRVNDWIDSAKTSKTRASRRASFVMEAAPGTPGTPETGGSFSEAPRATATAAAA
jgi:hypothetical protein